MKKFFAVIIATIIFPGALYAAESLYVQSKKARIMGEPNFSSEVKAVVKRGDKLDVLKQGGKWHMVSFGSAEGWINRIVVSENPPMQKVIVITGGEEELEKLARRRSSAITSAAAARGLSDADRERLSDKGRADFQNLEKLEKISRNITEQEIEIFAEAGN